MAEPYDIVVAGGGLIGTALALSLRDSGFKIALLEAQPRAAVVHDARTIALAYGSRLILERLGVWPDISATPIVRILVSQASSFGRTRLDAADAGVPALGYVTQYADLVAALRAPLGDLLLGDAPQARCIVHAEGAPADVPGKRYAQDALVALVATDAPAAETAFERFTAEGPLALLPMGARHALIWSARPERARELAALGDDAFLAELRRLAPRAVGRPVAVESRVVQPLMLKVRSARVSGNEVYIGNAAQTLHPVAGQGLNLGLRDAWELARTLARAADPGDGAVLARFAAARRIDAGATVRITDLLAAGFADSSALLGAARGAALTALDIFPPARRFFARRMIYGAQALP